MQDQERSNDKARAVSQQVEQEQQQLSQQRQQVKDEQAQLASQKLQLQVTSPHTPQHLLSVPWKCVHWRKAKWQFCCYMQQ